MSGGGGEQNTVSEFKPPDYTVPGWQQYVANAENMSQNPLPRYEGQTVAPMTAQHMQGANMLANLAQNGTASGNAANTMLYNTLMGGFDNPYATTSNPYDQNAFTDQVINRANQKTLDAYNMNATANDRSHAMSRTMGSDKQMLQQQKMADALGEGLNANATNALSQNFYANQGIAENQINRATGAVDAERQRQMQAAGMGGQQQQMDLQAIQALMGSGDMQRSYQQDLLNAQMQDWERWFQDPQVRQDLLGNALTRASGGAGTTSSQIMGGMSPWQSAAGLGLLGASLYQGMS